jgi:hypothetical protein
VSQSVSHQSKFSHCHFVHHKFHTDWRRLQSVPKLVALQTNNYGSLYVYSVTDRSLCSINSVHTLLTYRKVIADICCPAPSYVRHNAVCNVSYFPKPSVARSQWPRGIWPRGRGPRGIWPLPIETVGSNSTGGTDVSLL